MPMKCEDCGTKWPTYGILGEKPKTRWCASCAKKQEGVTVVEARVRHKKMCEHCSLKPARRDHVSKKARWCADCQGFMLMAEATRRAPAEIKKEQVELVVDAGVETVSLEQQGSVRLKVQGGKNIPVSL